MRTIVWFRGKDLRISDHAPLRSAVEEGECIPLFVLDPYFFAPERARELPHRIQFLLDSLEELAGRIEELGSELVLVRGKSVDVVPALAERWGADRVVAHRWVEPFGRERDRRIADALGDRFALFEGETLLAPGTLRTGAGDPYAVFTPFAKAFHRSAEIGEPLPAPERLPALADDIEWEGAEFPSLDSLGIERNEKLQNGGESRAYERLRHFLDGASAGYAEMRDRMDVEGTSRLSADVKFGTLSPRTIWRALDEAQGSAEDVESFRNELIWREFSYSTLWDRPELLERPFRENFEGFPWEDDPALWKAWVQGKTGYPVVDASARQLLHEGFVHNRARMISASFLTKHLLTDYRRGEAHYMKFLTDGDWANNNAGWQWSAGCGCDAQPYFRVFNPMTQGKKLDPDGAYVRQWVPELRALATKYVHAPWEAPASALMNANVVLGENYPRPVVDHKQARERFLETANLHLRSGERRKRKGQA